MMGLPNMEIKMTPSGPHAPPTAPEALTNVRDDPPSMSIRLSCPSAKNATDLLSGDQNGKRAPSVPGSTRGDTVLSGRSHKRDWPSDVAANVSVWPSGESANDAGSLVGGAAIWTYISRRAVAGETATGRHRTLTTATTESSTTPVSQAIRS